jgi:hypothetical protein
MFCVSSAKSAGGLAFSVFLAALALAVIARTQASDALKQEDQSFVRAFSQQKRTALDALMDANFIWIDSNGKRLSRAAVLQKLPTVRNSDVEMQSRNYGHVAVVRANRGRVNVLRVWRKRPGGWRAVLYQEVTQVEKAESLGGACSEECVNPCKTICDGVVAGRDERNGPE